MKRLALALLTGLAPALACVHATVAPAPSLPAPIAARAAPVVTEAQAETALEAARPAAATCERASDQDCDGIDDAHDHCPREPEDCDGFEDADGCPELDNDGDLLADGCDRCPDAAEDFDGEEDDDGCPEGEPGYGGRELRVASWIEFRRGTAVLEPAQRALLGEVIGSVLDTPALTRLACVGTRSADEPAALAMQRARAVCDLLRAAGVADERLALATGAPTEEREELIPPRAVYFATLETREVRLREVRASRVQLLAGGPVPVQQASARGTQLRCPGGRPVPAPVATLDCGRARRP